MPSLRTSPTSFFFPSMTPHGLGCPLGWLGSAVPAVCPHTPCAPPAHSLVGWGKEQEGPCSVSPAQQSLKHPAVINTVPSTDPKHSPILAAVKKISSSTAKHVLKCFAKRGGDDLYWYNGNFVASTLVITALTRIP